MNISERKGVMCGGNIYGGQSPSGIFPDLIHLLAHNPSSARATILHASTTWSAPEMPYFSFETCLTYVPSSTSVLAAKYSGPTSWHTKQRCRGSSQHAFVLANVPRKRSSTNSSGLEKLSMRSYIQPTLFCSRGADQLLFAPFTAVTMKNTFSDPLSAGIPSVSVVCYLYYVRTLPCHL